jgi:HD-GYP domain-containing protein (c-di-GMP phosphodiesterase class II)
VVARWGGEEFVVLGQGDTEADAWIWADRVRRAIAAAISLEGSKDPLTASIGVVVVPTDEFGEAAISRADQAMYLAKESGRNRVCTWRMVTAIDAAHLAQMQASMTPRQRLRAVVDHLHGDLGRTQSEHLGVHGREVRELAMRVGRMMIKDRDELHDLEVAAEFHDIGKVGIPESLLALPRRLTEEERRFMDEHARFGAEVIRACGASERAARMVEEHHRRFDACAEHGEPISMGAMILGACDAVVTMQSRRPYGEPRTPTQALAELRAERGRQFDPDVVDTLQFVSHPAAA